MTTTNPTVFETLLNARLSDLLRQQGLNSQPEFIVPNSGGKRIDVIVSLAGNCQVALEAEKGLAKKSQAQAEAEGRLALSEVDSAVAICYPDGLTQASDLDENTQLSAKPMSSGWVRCDLAGLVSIINKIPQELGNPDVAAKILEKKIKSAVATLSAAQLKDIAGALGLPPGKKGWEGRAAQRGLLVVAAASMFHARLDNENLDKPQTDARAGKPFTGVWPPDKLQTCLASQSITQSLKKAWGLILAVDYKPVFETSLAVLDAPAYDPKWESAVNSVAEAALQISGSVSSLRHDLLGRLFHRLLLNAKHDGSFYTSTAAASLLAGLAITVENLGGGNQQLQEMRIVDPACGTGTLLMAAAERMQDINPGGPSTVLGQALLEDILHGYDINLSATHMAATTLGLLAPNIKFRNMNIYETLFGVINNVPYIGSLDLYSGTAKHSSLSARLGYLPAPTRQIDDEDEQETLELLEHDLVIMNPPYTRDSLRYGQMTDVDKDTMKDHEKKVFANAPVHHVGGANMFLILADKLSRQRNGCVALVAPLSLAGAPNADETWQHLLSKFWVEIVVVSHDPERIYFSENTAISEMLIVMRRNLDDYGWDPPPAKILRLGKNPSQPTQTVPIYEAHHKNKLHDLPDSTLWEWPQEKLRANDWTPVKFYSNFLTQTVLDWFEGGQIPTKPLGDIAEVGPAGQGVRGAFDKGKAPSGNLGAKALWDNDTKYTYTMTAKPILNIKPKSGKDKQARDLWDKRGNLLIPARFSTPSMLMGAVWSQTPILGSSWVPVKPRNIGDENGIHNWGKAVCVWLNSSAGILAQFYRSTPKKIVYPAMSIDGQRKIHVPNFTPDQIRQLAGVFDKQMKTTQERLSNPSAAGRVALDNAVVEALGIDLDTMNQVRGELAKEPAITDQQYGS